MYCRKKYLIESSFSVLNKQLCVLLFLFNSFSSFSQISGSVFRDFNGSGIKDNTSSFNEIGLGGVVIKAYNSSGTQVGGTQTTSSTGAYSFTGLTLPVRLEFTLPSGYYASRGGIGNSTVQFYSSSTTTANLGVNHPEDYVSSENPKIAVPCYINGNPLGGGTAGGGDAFVLFNNTAGGTTLASAVPQGMNVGDVQGTATVPVHAASANEIGAVWGVAYKKDAKVLFTSAFIKRHIGLGSLGIGGIYKIDLSGGTPVASNFVNVSSIGIDVGTIGTNASRGLPNSKDLPSYDLPGFNNTGKLGIGDLDISANGDTLFFVNLKDKKVYSLDVSNPNSPPTAALGSYTIPSPNCVSGKFRPWALKYYRGEVYVGGVCSGEDESWPQGYNNLVVYIYKMKPSSGFNTTPVLTFNLPQRKTWKGWNDKFDFWNQGSASFWENSQPLISDIEFDVDGSMIIGITDLFGNKSGYQNFGIDVNSSSLNNGVAFGDILRAYNNNGTFVIESNGTAGPITTAGANNNYGQNGPSSGRGEFYYGDFAVDNNFNLIGFDATMGALALLPGRSEVVSTISDPVAALSGGIIWLSNTTGNWNSRYLLYNSAPNSGGELGTSGKANGLGDIELLSDPAPIEIGNRVWVDENQNGIQDAGEAPISGITVTLCLASNPSTPIATAVTDANGNYYFSSGSGTNTASVKYNLNLLSNTSYILKFPTTSGTKSLTTANSGSNDLIDSDANASGQITFTTGEAGENNHSFDVGYKACTPPIANATSKTQTICVGGTVTAYTATPSTGVAYKWYGPLADTTSSLGTAISGATNASYTPTGTALTTAGTKYYAVVVNTTGEAACADTAFVRLVVNAKPNIANGSATICAGESVNLTTQITNYGTYLSPVWTLTTAGGTAVATPTSVKPSSTTTYVLVAQNASGCKDTAQVVVTVNAKPNAGSNQTLACANPSTNTLTTSATLVPSPSGGTWSQLGTTPVTATISGNNVTGMNVVGTYQFVYSLNGCKDTVSVTVQACVGCVKPNAGADAASVCQPTKTAKLTAVTSGGTWSVIGSPSNPSVATIDASGNISGLNAAGTYRFVYSVTSGGQTCTDTAQVVVNAKPNIANGSATICAGESVNLTTQITNYGTYLSPVWTLTTAGGTAVATPTSVKPSSTTTYVLVAQNASGCKDTAQVVVTVNAKPSAGTDQTLACANPSTNTLTTSATLVPSPSGGTWSQLGTTPATATISGNNVTNMTVAGTYQFVYSLNGCKDTVSVTVQSCAGCVKPNAGADAASVCQPTSTAKLTAVTSGGTWSVIGSPSNPSSATIDASGNISGLNAAGTYRFVYSVTSGGQTCTDTAQVVVKAKPNAGADILSTNAICTTVGTAQLSGSPAGGAWSQLGTSPSVATIAPSGSVSGMTTVGIYQFIYSLNGCIDTVAVETKSCVSPEVDLALKKSINKKIAKLGDTLTYTIQVFNQSSTGATGVEVVDSIATTVGFISGSFVASRGSASITGNVIKWTIGNIGAPGDTVRLIYKVKAISEGIHFNTAEISKVNEKDVDSTPGNGKESEDDIDGACFSVPLQLCVGQKLEVTVPSRYTNVVWYKEGSATAIAMGNVVLLGEVGTYTFSASNQTCPAGGCCPVIIEEGTSCCPTDICIPFMIQKQKKK
ncbi:SdrD B-like domain-containing protein [Runella sp. MFBS21]|uniref:SdrD B-like domain-containing protein n=1 Tax=Runella sp. MFBS21 TaxID=3034018 RepID=UPI0023F694E6|nr:SdrD B-like domain-containing protein [Runella sp. MFBS21]MDF7819374.1 SdrD B-like domain-containing protein [Runella sp. MFBS21]